jgi:hypothetical protein
VFDVIWVGLVYNVLDYEVVDLAGSPSLRGAVRWDERWAAQRLAAGSEMSSLYNL